MVSALQTRIENPVLKLHTYNTESFSSLTHTPAAALSVTTSLYYARNPCHILNDSHSFTP